MKHKKYPGVSSFMKRGKLMWRYRKTGQKTVYLPGVFESLEWMMAYEAALNGVKPTVDSQSAIAPYSFNWLVRRYYASDDFRALAKLTQKTRASTLDWVCHQVGTADARSFNGKTVKALQTLKREQAPAGKSNKSAADKVHKYLSVVFNWAMRPEQGYVKSNPTQSLVREKETDGYAAWPETWLQHWMDLHGSGTRERLVLMLGFHLGLSRVDICKATKSNIEGVVYRYRRQKNQNSAEGFQIHPDLQAELSLIPHNQFMMVVNDSGNPYKPETLGNWFQKARKRSGVPTNLSIHGLRKSGAIWLADNSAITVPALQTFLNDKDPRMAMRYIEQANNRKAAKRAAAGVQHLSLATIGKSGSQMLKISQ